VLRVTAGELGVHFNPSGRGIRSRRRTRGARRAAGLRVVDSVLAEEAKWQGSSPLTGRETEVLRAAETAGSVKEIAGMLGLSSGTVRNHLSAAMAKIDAINRHEAVRIARDNGWL